MRIYVLIYRVCIISLNSCYEYGNEKLILKYCIFIYDPFKSVDFVYWPNNDRMLRSNLTNPQDVLIILITLIIPSTLAEIFGDDLAMLCGCAVMTEINAFLTTPNIFTAFFVV